MRESKINKTTSRNRTKPFFYKGLFALKSGFPLGGVTFEDKNMRNPCCFLEFHA